MLVIYLKGCQREIMDTILHVAESIMIKLLVKQTLASIKGAAKTLVSKHCIGVKWGINV